MKRERGLQAEGTAGADARERVGLACSPKKTLWLDTVRKEGAEKGLEREGPDHKVLRFDPKALGADERVLSRGDT